jgi:hypothetical protein
MWQTSQQPSNFVPVKDARALDELIARRSLQTQHDLSYQRARASPDVRVVD